MTGTQATLRRATADDQAIIRQIVIKDIGLDPTDLHWSHFVLAEIDGKIVSLGQIRPSKSAPELGSIATLPDHRGKGYAAMIIRRLLDDWEQPGPVYLECEYHNVTYYQKLGFVEIPLSDVPPSVLRFKHGVGAVLGKLFGIRGAVMKIER